MKHININFNFMKWHKKAIYFSMFLILISVVSIFTKGLNYGVDFKGGTIIEISFNNIAPIEDVRKFLKEHHESVLISHQLKIYTQNEERYR